MLADFIAAGYNINACTWLVASGPSQLELVVIDWFRRWLGYPQGAHGPAFPPGHERADSIGLDAHEWLFQPHEAGCLLVKDVRETLQAIERFGNSALLNRGG